VGFKSEPNYFFCQYVDIFSPTSAETIQKHYLVGSQTIAENTISNGVTTLYWLLSDQVGSTTVAANADGSWSGQILYTAFGEIRSASGNTPTQYRYTGQLADSYIKLDWYASRFYDLLISEIIWVERSTRFKNLKNQVQ
jgi:hypothetical protein